MSEMAAMQHARLWPRSGCFHGQNEHHDSSTDQALAGTAAAILRGSQWNRTSASGY